MTNSQKGQKGWYKRLLKQIVLLAGLLATTSLVPGQSLERLDISFSEDGSPLTFPLAGGLNSPQFSAVDLNNDGLQDLHVFDRVGNKQLAFLNNGSTQSLPYTFAPQYLKSFPSITNWMLLRDYNGDEIMDIFAYSDESFDAVMVFTGYYENDEIHFKRFFFDEPNNVIYFPRASGGSSQLFVSTIDYPAIDDIDCDGDLDILTFNLVGGFVEWYANKSVEQGFGRDSLIFTLDDRCWGGFFESGVSNVVDLAETSGECVNQLRNGDLEIRHTGSTLLTFDADGDDDKELILGDISFNEINFLTNGGSCAQPWMTEQDAAFPSYDAPAEVPVFPASFYLDVDNDGLKDLLVAPNASLNGTGRAVWRYKNVGVANQANFRLAQQDFLVDQMLDLGSGARPVFLDYNVDGLQDLVIANSSFYEPFGMKNARLHLYENVGTPTQADYQLVDDDYLNLNQFSQNAYAFTPSFGDLDDDGDLDAVIGEQGGRLFFAENNAGEDQPLTFKTAQYNYMDIFVGQASVPQIIDLNRDGLADLIIGERNGNVNYFQNQGTKQEAFFSSEPDQMVLGGVDTRIPGFTTGYSAPLIIEEDGQFLLLTGTEIGRVELYGNIDGNLNGSFTLINEDFGQMREGSRTQPALADLDDDGLLELAIGNFSGGIGIFQTDLQANMPVSVRNKPPFLNDLKISPNPTSNQIRISVEEPMDQAELKIFNANGQLVYRANWQTKSEFISVSSWPAGVYLVQLTSNDGIRVKKLLVN